MLNMPVFSKNVQGQRKRDQVYDMLADGYGILRIIALDEHRYF